MILDHCVILECQSCRGQSEQDAREVRNGLVVECCGEHMAEVGESYTDDFARRENERRRW